MRTLVWSGLALLLAACGGSGKPEEGSHCDLPGCEASETLGRVDGLVGPFGSNGLLYLRHSNTGWELLFRDLGTGVETSVAVDVAPFEIKLYAKEGRLLLVERPGAGTEEYPLRVRGRLILWDAATLTRTVLADDARVNQHGLCGDRVWFWHGDGDESDGQWCDAPLEVLELRDGSRTVVDDACAFTDTDGALAAFDADCSHLIHGSRWGGGVSRLDLATGTSELLASTLSSRFLSSADGRWVAIDGFGFNQFTREHLRLVDLDGTAREVTETNGPSRPLVFSPDGSELLIQDDDGIARLDTATNGLQRITDNRWSLETVAASPDGRAFLWQQDHAHAVWIHEAGEFAPIELPGAVEMSGATFVGGGQYVVYRSESGLAAWDRLRKAALAVAVGEIWDFIVHPDGERIAWIENGKLWLGDRSGRAPGLVAPGAAAAKFVGNRIAWTDYYREGHLLSLP